MKKPKIQGSMLVVTMIIMGMILFVSLSVSLVSIRERKASMGSGRSNSAFQTADSGVEIVLQKIKDAVAMSDLADVANGITCDGTTGFIESTRGFTVELKDENGLHINCYDTARDVSEIASIKSIGTDDGKTQQRAIEAAVAGSGGSGITGGCVVKFMPGGCTEGGFFNAIAVLTRWGDGCKPINPFNSSTLKFGDICSRKTTINTVPGVGSYYTGKEPCNEINQDDYICGPASNDSLSFHNVHYVSACICIKEN